MRPANRLRTAAAVDVAQIDQQSMAFDFRHGSTKPGTREALRNMAGSEGMRNAQSRTQWQAQGALTGQADRRCTASGRFGAAPIASLRFV